MTVDDRHTDLVPFPIVRLAQGGCSPDGRVLLVEAATGDGRLLRFAISLSDIHHFISFLLVSACKPVESLATEDTGPAPGLAAGAPIPVTSIAVGGQCGEDARLGIAVGPTELTFAVPLSQFDRLARAMLTMRAEVSSKYRM